MNSLRLHGVSDRYCCHIQHLHVNFSSTKIQLTLLLYFAVIIWSDQLADDFRNSPFASERKRIKFSYVSEFWGKCPCYFCFFSITGISLIHSLLQFLVICKMKTILVFNSCSYLRILNHIFQYRIFEFQIIFYYSPGLFIAGSPWSGRCVLNVRCNNLPVSYIHILYSTRDQRADS